MAWPIIESAITPQNKKEYKALVKLFARFLIDYMEGAALIKAEEAVDIFRNMKSNLTDEDSVTIHIDCIISAGTILTLLSQVRTEKMHKDWIS